MRATYQRRSDANLAQHRAESPRPRIDTAGRNNGTRGPARVVRCLSRCIAARRKRLLASSHAHRSRLPSQSHLDTLLCARIEHSDEICHVSLGCILAAASFFLSIHLSVLFRLFSLAICRFALARLAREESE